MDMCRRWRVCKALVPKRSWTAANTRGRCLCCSPTSNPLELSWRRQHTTPSFPTSPASPAQAHSAAQLAQANRSDSPKHHALVTSTNSNSPPRPGLETDSANVHLPTGENIELSKISDYPRWPPDLAIKQQGRPHAPRFTGRYLVSLIRLLRKLGPKRVEEELCVELCGLCAPEHLVNAECLETSE
jgi:hypothetical protein